MRVRRVCTRAHVEGSANKFPKLPILPNACDISRLRWGTSETMFPTKFPNPPQRDRIGAERLS